MNSRVLIAKILATWMLAVSLIGLNQLHAQTQPVAQVEHIYGSNPGAPIAQAVSVPAGYDTFYLSGNIPPVANAAAPKGSPETYGDTQAQTVAVLTRIEQTLSSLKLSLADVVMMHVYLVGDPAKEGKMDFTGFMAGYSQFFGTKTQPNRPARSTMQVAALVAPGVLVEIEAIAARPRLQSNEAGKK